MRPTERVEKVDEKDGLVKTEQNKTKHPLNDSIFLRRKK